MKRFAKLKYFILANLLSLCCYNTSALMAQSIKTSPEYQLIKKSNKTLLEKESSINNLLEKHLCNNNNELYAIDTCGLAYLLYQKDINKGIAYVKRSIRFQELMKLNNNKLSVFSNKLLGYLFQKKQDYINSNKYYKKLITIATSNYNKGFAYKMLAKNSNAEGNFHTAIKYYKKAIDLFKKDKKHKQLLSTAIKLSITHQEILNEENIREGIDNLKQLDTLRSYYKFSTSDDFLINETLGNLYNSSDTYDTYSCLPYYKKALDLALKLKSPSKASSIYNNIGNIFHKKNNDSALFYFKKALKISNKNTVNTSKTLYNIGLCYMDQKKHKQASKNFLSALSKLNTHTNDTVIRYKDKKLAISIYKSMAISSINKYESESKEAHYLNNALEYLKKSDQLIDLIKLENTQIASKLFWRQQASDLYINLVKIYYLKNNVKKAYHYLEKNKALLLLEDLSKEQSKVFFHIPPVVLEKEQILKHEIATIKNKLEVSNSNSNKSLELQLFDKTEDYKYFLDSLQPIYPKYYSYKNTDEHILSFEKTTKLAKESNTTFIHYILNNNEGYGLVVNNHQNRLFKIENTPLLQEQLHKFRQLTSTPFNTKKDKYTFEKTGKSISEHLIPKAIKPLLNTKIVIIPDYTLYQIPFETLVQNNDKYLIEDYEINYAYSISFQYHNKKLERKTTKEFLGFAPVSYANNLMTLPKSESEIHQIKKDFDYDILMHKNASKEKLISHLKEYKIIHLSTHANANDSITPWIATATNKISLNDIYATKNNAELIVLSACNTSTGKLQKGEGVMSLARGFFNTGANSVLATLWKADDESTLKLTTDFYAYLKKGYTKSASLRLAKIKYLNNHSLQKASPYYWSSLILIGASDPLYSSNTTIWFLIIGSSILILLFFILKFKFYKKR